VEEGKSMRRFQNATMEYNVAKNELVIRDVNNNGIFFAIDFFENSKQIKRVFSLYPVSVEINKNKIEKGTELISQFKIFITYAYGAGEGFPHQIINKPFIPESNSVCTETYLVISPFETKDEACNALKYMKTKK